MRAQAAVLTYHSHNVFSADYGGNDHVALADDLRTIRAMGARIVPLKRIVEAVQGKGDQDELLVGLTFDDGPVFDVVDFEHSRYGRQRAFINIMKDFISEAGSGVQPEMHATSFVIASPDARRDMERSPDCGYPSLGEWLTDAWWEDVSRTGLISIGNHSWDHVHHAVREVAIHGDERDNFARVDNYADADREIRRAKQHIDRTAGVTCEHFAYPFGHTNPYLTDDYFPGRAGEHGMKAAFGTGGRKVRAGDSVWNIPRLVCGEHWKSPADLRSILLS